MEKIEDKTKGIFGKIFSTKSKKDNSISSDPLLNWEFIIDSEGNYLNISHEVQQCLGISSDEFNNQSIFTFSIYPSSGENLFKKFSNRVFPLEENVIFVSIDNKQVFCNLKLTTFIEQYNQKPTYIGLAQVITSDSNSSNSENFSKPVNGIDGIFEQKEKPISRNGHEPQIGSARENLEKKQEITEETPLSKNLPMVSYAELHNQFSIEINHLIDPIEIYKFSFAVLNQIFPEDDILLAIQDKENNTIEMPIFKMDNEVIYFHEDDQFLNIASKIIQSNAEIADGLNAQLTHEAKAISFPHEPTSYFGSPVVCGNRNLGAILIFNESRKEFETDKLVALKKISTTMGYALENAKFFYQMQNALDAIDTREKYQNLIIQAIKIISIDGLENLKTAFEMLGKVTNTQRIFLAQPDNFKHNRSLKITHQWTSDQKFDTSHLPQQLPGDYFEVHSAKLQAAGYLKVDFEKLDSPFFEWLERRGTSSILLLAISQAGEDFSILALEDLYQNHFWKNEEITYLRTIAEILSQKLITDEKIINLNDKLLDSEKYLKILTSIDTINFNQYINNNFSILLNHIQKLLKDSLKANTVIIHFKDENTNSVLPREIETVSDLIDEVIETKKPKAFINSQSDRSFISASISNTQVITPIQHKVLGQGVVIFIYNKVIEFDDNNIQNHQLITDKISSLFEKYHLLKENDELAQTVSETEEIKNRFISNISHEFRTPLNSIIGFSKVILTGIDGPINDTQKQDLNTINSSGQTLLRMVNDILDISKIESGNMELEKTRTEVKSFIKSLLPEIEEIVKEKVIEYEFSVEDNLPEIFLDRNRIKQVIFHLISNATKNTEFGKISLLVNYKHNIHERPEIVFSVIDTGKGIEISDQKDLFKPFTLLSHHEKNRSAGSGLGLALSKAIVNLHGGKIGIKSSIPGKGSEFYFTLPIK
jgi:signal transduction histidine kinase